MGALLPLLQAKERLATSAAPTIVRVVTIADLGTHCGPPATFWSSTPSLVPASEAHAVGPVQTAVVPKAGREAVGHVSQEIPVRWRVLR
jgi:hypothetical protein